VGTKLKRFVVAAGHNVYSNAPFACTADRKLYGLGLVFHADSQMGLPEVGIQGWDAWTVANRPADQLGVQIYEYTLQPGEVIDTIDFWVVNPPTSSSWPQNWPNNFALATGIIGPNNFNYIAPMPSQGQPYQIMSCVQLNIVNGTTMKQVVVGPIFQNEYNGVQLIKQTLDLNGRNGFVPVGLVKSVQNTLPPQYPGVLFGAKSLGIVTAKIPTGIQVDFDYSSIPESMYTSGQFKPQDVLLSNLRNCTSISQVYSVSMVATQSTNVSIGWTKSLQMDVNWNFSVKVGYVPPGIAGGPTVAVGIDSGGSCAQTNSTSGATITSTTISTSTDSSITVPAQNKTSVTLQYFVATNYRFRVTATPVLTFNNSSCVMGPQEFLLTFNTAAGFDISVSPFKLIVTCSQAEMSSELCDEPPTHQTIGNVTIVSTVKRKSSQYYMPKQPIITTVLGKAASCTMPDDSLFLPLPAAPPAVPDCAGMGQLWNETMSNTLIANNGNMQWSQPYSG